MASIKDMPEEEHPLSVQIDLARQEWLRLKRKADLLKNLKEPTLERLKQELINREGDMPDSHATRRVKASEEWHDYIRGLSEAVDITNLASAKVKFLEAKFSEWQASDANQRAERRYSR